jgi:hypothetical protein
MEPKLDKYTLLKLGDELEIDSLFGSEVSSPTEPAGYSFNGFKDITTEEFVGLVANKQFQKVQLILMSDLYGAFGSLLKLERYDLLNELLNYSIPYYHLAELITKLYRHYYIRTRDPEAFKLIKRVLELPNFIRLEAIKFGVELHEAVAEYQELTELVTAQSNYLAPSTQDKYTSLRLQTSNLHFKIYEIRLGFLFHTEYKAMYDVFEKWSLVLPIDLFVYRLDHTELFQRVRLDKELAEAKGLNKYQILNPSAIPCTIDNYGTSFEAYLSRSHSSLRADGIYVILGDNLDDMPLGSLTRGLYGGDVELAISSPMFRKACEKMFYPLIIDIGNWNRSGLRLSLNNLAFVKMLNQYHVRMFASTFDREDLKLYLKYSPSLGKQVLEFAVVKLFRSECKLRAIKFSPDLDSYSKFKGYFFERLTQYLAGRIEIPVTHSETVNTIFDVTPPNVGKTLDERNIAFASSLMYPPNQRLAIDTFYLGIDIFYNGGSGLIQSVESGDDYILKHLSMQRLYSYLRDKNRAYRLIATAGHACSSNSNAFIFILTHDQRPGRSGAISYEKYRKDLLLNIQAVSRGIHTINPDRNVIVEKNLYVQYRGPGYESFL